MLTDDPEYGTTTVAMENKFGGCCVSQMGATFSYNMEYYGPCAQLVFTPLTERAFLTLTMALKAFSCGSLIGPAGMGKSETINDLSKVRPYTAEDHFLKCFKTVERMHPLGQCFLNAISFAR